MGSSPSRSQIFKYKGRPEQYVVPEGVTKLRITVMGSAGGGFVQNGIYPAGKGSYIKATLAVKPGDVLMIVVGAKGGNCDYGIPDGRYSGGLGGYGFLRGYDGYDKNGVTTASGSGGSSVVIYEGSKLHACAGGGRTATEVGKSGGYYVDGSVFTDVKGSEDVNMEDGSITIEPIYAQEQPLPIPKPSVPPAIVPGGP